MASLATRAAADLEAGTVDVLAARHAQTMLRFITCGSVDDGKSTLIGRLLYDSKLLLDDQLATLAKESAVSGTQGTGLDFALLVDGLAAEREQGITIDVAYRFFATDRRKFIVADTPGHEQYTRNMATGASTADLAIILIDARKGVLTQTRRHSLLANLLGIRQLVLAVNKMDLVRYDRSRFDEIVADYRAFANGAGIGRFTAIPVSGLAGDNVSARSEKMDWYDGPALIEHLESATAERHDQSRGPLRMPVQWVNRPNADFRGYSGRVSRGSIAVGDEIAILPSLEQARVARIVTYDGDLARAKAGQSVTITLDREVDCSRGDIIVAAGSEPTISARFEASLVWMSGDPLEPGRSYLLKMGARTVAASVGRIQEIVDVNSFAPSQAQALGLNDIGRCEIRLDRALPILPYEEDRNLGGFILIDRLSNATVAAGMIRRAKSEPTARSARGAEIFWLSAIAPEARETAARKLERQLKEMGARPVLIGAESLRDLNDDLGHDDEDEGHRRLREIARLLTRAGLDVIVTAQVKQADAWPGQWIDDQAASAEGAAEWVI